MKVKIIFLGTILLFGCSSNPPKPRMPISHPPAFGAYPIEDLWKSNLDLINGSYISNLNSKLKSGELRRP